MAKTVVLFLGDNVYKVGLPDDQVITYAVSPQCAGFTSFDCSQYKSKIIYDPGQP